MASQVPAVLVTPHGGGCTWTRWPPLPTLSTRPLRGSYHCPDFVGWAGLRWGSPCTGSCGTAWGSWQEGACTQPGTERAGPLSAVSTPSAREGPGPRVGTVPASPTWGLAALEPQGVVGLRAHCWARRSHCLPPTCPSHPLRHHGDGSALLCAAVPQLVRSGRGGLGRVAAGGEGSFPHPSQGQI